jgi:hypothetical protein
MTANVKQPDFWVKRDTESAEAHRRRIAPFMAHREDAQAEAAQLHAEFRQQQEQRTQGTGYGLFSGFTDQERTAAAGAAFAGSQKLEKLGGLSVTATRGQVAVQRVYAADLSEGHAAISPLFAHLHGDSSERWR